MTRPAKSHVFYAHRCNLLQIFTSMLREQNCLQPQEGQNSRDKELSQYNLYTDHSRTNMPRPINGGYDSIGTIRTTWIPIMTSTSQSGRFSDDTACCAFRESGHKAEILLDTLQDSVCDVCQRFPAKHSIFIQGRRKCSYLQHQRSSITHNAFAAILQSWVIVAAQSSRNWILQP